MNIELQLHLTEVNMEQVTFLVDALKDLKVSLDIHCVTAFSAFNRSSHCAKNGNSLRKQTKT